MSALKIIFVGGNNEGLSAKDRELRNNTIRARAAVFGHQRRENIQSKRPNRLPQLCPRPAATSDFCVAVAPRAPARDSDDVVVLDQDEPGQSRDSNDWSNHALNPPPYLSSQRIPSPWTGFGGFRTELYDISPHWTDQETKRALDFYLSSLAPRYDLLSELFNITNADVPLLDFISHKPFFHAFISLVTYHYEQANRPGAEPSEDVWRHRGCALNLLRKAMQSSSIRTDDLTFYTIVFLAQFDKTLGHDELLSMHVKALTHLVAKEGGLKNISNDMTRVMLLTYDSVWGISGAAATLSVEMPRTRGTRSDIIDVSQLPVGFQRLAGEGSLSDDTLTLLNRAVNLGFSSRSKIQMEGLLQRRRHIRPYDSLYEACPALHAADDSDFILDKAICLALVIFSHTAFGSLRFAPTTFYAARAELTRLLSSVISPPSSSTTTTTTTTSSTATETPARTWCWLLAIDSWRTNTCPESRRPRLLPEGRALCSRFRNESPHFLASASASCWQQLQEVVDLFFWSSDLTTFWRRHWHGMTLTLTSPAAAVMCCHDV